MDRGTERRSIARLADRKPRRLAGRPGRHAADRPRIVRPAVTRRAPGQPVRCPARRSGDGDGRHRAPRRADRGGAGCARRPGNDRRPPGVGVARRHRRRHTPRRGPAVCEHQARAAIRRRGGRHRRGADPGAWVPPTSETDAQYGPREDATSAVSGDARGAHRHRGRRAIRRGFGRRLRPPARWPDSNHRPRRGPG